jgi:hypothetical protein
MAEWAWAANWQAVGTAVVSLMFVLVGLVYAIGVGFNLPKVKAWARNEFYQVVASAIIIGGIMVLHSSINGLMNSLAGSCPSGCSCPVDCPKDYPYFCDTTSPGYSVAFDSALCFINSMKLSLTTYTGEAMGMSILVGTLLSLKTYVAPYQKGFGFALAPGLFPIMDLLGLIMTFLSVGTAFFWAQGFILSFVRLKLIALLPIGIALRAFPFTRGAGAAIIALVCGLYIVFPLLVVLESWVVAKDISTYGPPEEIASIPVVGTLAYLGSIVGVGIYIVVIAAIFLPLVNVTLTFAFMKDFARLMGGEIDVSSLMKLL